MVTGKFNHSQVILVGMLSLVNALINPILYGKMSLRYRLGYLYIFKRTLSACGASKPDGSFFDGTRRAASTIARNSTTGASYKARQSIDAAFQDGGFKSAKEEFSTRRAGVRFEVNNKVDNEAEERTAFLLVEDGNANLKSPDTSSLQTSLRSEDEVVNKTDGEYSPLDESYDSAL